MNELLFILIMMTVNFVIVVIWYRQLFRDLVAAGVDEKELPMILISLQFQRTSNEVKGALVEFYFKLFVLILGSLTIKFIVGFQ